MGDQTAAIKFEQLIAGGTSFQDNEVGTRQPKEEPIDEVDGEETSAMVASADDESSLEETVIPRRRPGRPSVAMRVAEALAKAAALKAAYAKRDAALKQAAASAASPTATRVTRRSLERASPATTSIDTTTPSTAAAGTLPSSLSSADKASPVRAANRRAEKVPAERASDKKKQTLNAAASSSKSNRRSSRRKRKASESDDSEYSPSMDSAEDRSSKLKAMPTTAEKGRNGHIVVNGGTTPMSARSRLDMELLLSAKQRENRMPTCAVCNRTIGQKAAHIYTVHINKPTARCPLCAFNGQRGQVLHHLRVMHNAMEIDPIDFSAQYKTEFEEWMRKCFPISNQKQQRTLKELLDSSLVVSSGPTPPKPVSFFRVSAPKMECAKCKLQIGVTEAIEHVNTAHAHLVELSCPMDSCSASSPARRLILQHIFSLHRGEWRWPRSNLFDHAGEMDRNVRHCFGKGLAELKTAAEQVELGERCAVCCRPVTRPNRLMHAITHMNPEGPQLFKCSWCDFATRTDAEAVKEHARLVHGAEGVLSRLDEFKDEIDCWMATCFMCK
uniref:C2H2-type domain-containing protein n=1 Tax=Plectus sambesii TaxID=2011161 RepID=A0A914WXC4_9BILA